MRFSVALSFVVAFALIVGLGMESPSVGQSASTALENAGQVPGKVQNQNEQENKVQVQQEQSPYRLSSRVHLQRDSNKGYLIVQVDLIEGSYIYSLTQKGAIPASKLAVAHSPLFRLTGEFGPDRPATVVAHDPVFEQRVEKHLQRVQFFAPIEIAPGADPAKILAAVTFNGQVCTDQGFCTPLRNMQLTGKFAGYFQRSQAEKASANQDAQSSQDRAASASGNGSIRR